jgi:hypothetical protein
MGLAAGTICNEVYSGRAKIHAGSDVLGFVWVEQMVCIGSTVGSMQACAQIIAGGPTYGGG